MLTFSYTLFPTLKKDLENIDATRNKILCELIPPELEIRARFEALCHKTSSALFLSGKSISAKEVMTILEADKNNAAVKDVIEFKNANGYITRNWLLSPIPIRGKDILELLSEYSDSKLRDKRQLDQMIEFITVNPEHGIIQAALSFLLVSQALANDNNNIKLSSNVSNIFLYKYGYDFRGLLNLDEYWANDLATLQKAMHEGVEVKNLSSFLEYYVAAVSIQVEKALKKLRELNAQPFSRNRNYDLSPRQRRILSMFDKPGVKITNRDVQKEFKVSQITSSRDLSKLSTLGLIFPSGKGRSVFYTKL